jgi:molybdate transport system regulatory protein
MSSIAPAPASGRLSIRIELPNGSRLGPGKVALLESIGQRRSIAAAARDHDMSYRRAWLLIDDLNRAFSEPVVETFPGRSQGAGAALTAFGTRLVALFRATERRCFKAAAPSLREIAEASHAGYAAGELKRTVRKSGERA